MKINTHQNDSNFLSQGLWSKSKLGMQPTPTDAIDLGLCIFKENRHISRININDNYKIVINSPEVHFGLTRSHAEVEHN
jgi:hypothetical protein